MRHSRDTSSPHHLAKIRWDAPRRLAPSQQAQPTHDVGGVLSTADQAIHPLGDFRQGSAIRRQHRPAIVGVNDVDLPGLE